MKENEEVLQVFIWKGNLWNSNDDVNLHIVNFRRSETSLMKL
jgi:hypothetical protein